MSEILSISEQRMRSAIEAYFSCFDPATAPVSVHAALEVVREQIDAAVAFDDEFIIRSIEVYGVERGHVLRFDGHTD